MLGRTRRNGETTPEPLEWAGTSRVDPWSEFTRVRAQMDRLFGDLFGPTPRRIEEVSAFAPTTDMYETDEELVVQAYLPGISREDIHVEVTGDTIHLSGESKPTVPEKDVKVHVAQSNSGKFDVRYCLPVEIKAEQVKATYRNGVLEVRLPKVETVPPKTVEVKVDG